MLLMTLNQEAQKTAQAELDRVIPGQLPSFDDEPSLPYFSAVIMEMLRTNPPAIIGA
jgi:cytochrome P450